MAGGAGSTSTKGIADAWDSAGKDFPADKPCGSTTAPCPLAGKTNSADAKPTSDAKKPDCAFLDAKPDNAKMPKESYDRLRSGKATVGPKSAAGNYKWPDGSDSPPVSVQTVDVDGQKVQVYSPTNSDPKTPLPTTDQVAEALRALPPDQRKQTSEVVLSPHPSPDGASGDGGSGKVILYPTPGEPTQRNVDYRMTHESGHNVQETKWKSGDDVKDWGAAARTDGVSPSTYADNSPGEDFSEFLNVYNATKGTPCEKTAREKYPNRWKKMESYSKS